MAQPNVVREPSMEEILASIRRIIESNEPGAGKSISASLPPVYAEESDEEGDEEIHLTVDNDNRSDDVGAMPQARSFSELPPARTAATSVPPDNLRSIEDRKSMSLADVAARVRAASERNTAQLQQHRDTPPPPRLEMPAAAPRPIAVSRPVELRRPSEPSTAYEPQRVEPVSTHRNDPVPAADEPLAALTQVVQPFNPGPARPQPAPAVNQAMVAAETQPFDFDDRDHGEEMVSDTPTPQAEAKSDNDAKALLSPSAGDKVARSFSDLATMLDSPRRSIDEIAEEMLRPMLQEWLDDNLPTLVERLVREEIERVARGPRR